MVKQLGQERLCQYDLLQSQTCSRIDIALFEVDFKARDTQSGVQAVEVFHHPGAKIGRHLVRVVYANQQRVVARMDEADQDTPLR